MSPAAALPSHAVRAAAALGGASALLLALSAPAGAVAPIVAIVGATSSGVPGQIVDGATVTVKVGPNTLFDPLTRINLLECADTGGTAAGLPTDISGCDGATVQANSVIVAKDGSFSSTYTMYQLPSATLGEQANRIPVCNGQAPCVLYVGEDQEDFTQPHVFSAPFAMTSAAGGPPPATSGATGETGAAAGGAPATPGEGAGALQPAGSTAHSSGAPVAAAGSAPSASVSLAAGTLAFTGAPTTLPWMVELGSALLFVGVLLRIVGRRIGT